MANEKELTGYARHYSKDGFHRKVSRMSRRACWGVIEKTLLLYVILTDRATPMWARILIIGALGHFIWTMDAIPDSLPLLGYVDDAAVMAFALSRLAQFVTPAVRERVERLMPTGNKRPQTIKHKEK